MNAFDRDLNRVLEQNSHAERMFAGDPEVFRPLARNALLDSYENGVSYAELIVPVIHHKMKAYLQKKIVRNIIREMPAETPLDKELNDLLLRWLPEGDASYILWIAEKKRHVAKNILRRAYEVCLEDKQALIKALDNMIKGRVLRGVSE